MQEITIKNSSGDSFTVLPDLGAAISSLIINNEQVIKYPLVSEDAKKGYPSALLFPFPNRVRDGKYSFEDKNYQLDLNESRGHALHGFVAHDTFVVTEQKATSVTLEHSYAGGVNGYPFPFLFQVKYSLPKKNIFRLTYHVKNKGTTNMPCGFGWHPYFSLGDHKISDLELKVPPHYMIEVDDSVIPFQSNDANGQLLVEAKSISLRNTILDNVFKAVSVEGTSSVLLQSPTHELEIRQQTGGGKLNYFVLYTPPVRSCIAIEPQTSNINAFNNQEGLLKLSPGGVATGYIEVLLREK